MDINKLYEGVKAAEAPRENRIYIDKAGRHVVKIVSALQKESQQGKDMIILEMDVLSSTCYEEGEGLKQIFTLNGQQSFFIERNLGYIKSIIGCACPDVDLTSEFLSACVTGGTESALAGQTLMVISTLKRSEKTGRDFTLYSYKEASADTVVGKPPAEAASSAPSVSAPKASSSAGADVDEPPFDI
jgi:hypothetical protein